MAQSRMVQYVKRMNIAFGNPEGNPTDFTCPGNDAAWGRLQKQCENIGGSWLGGVIDGEVLELLNALRARDIDKVRDGLADILVFAIGAFHVAGYDADADMEAVLDGVMTRFCKDRADLDATLAKWAARGVTDVYTQGQFPCLCVKVASDQTAHDGERFPRGKFLKSASYREPILPPAPVAVDIELPAAGRVSSKWTGPVVTPLRRADDTGAGSHE